MTEPKHTFTNPATARRHALGVNKRVALAMGRLAEVDATLRQCGNTGTDPALRRLWCDERDILQDYIHILKLQTEYFQQ